MSAFTKSACRDSNCPFREKLGEKHFSYYCTKLMLLRDERERRAEKQKKREQDHAAYQERKNRLAQKQAEWEAQAWEFHVQRVDRLAQKQADWEDKAREFHQARTASKTVLKSAEKADPVKNDVKLVACEDCGAQCLTERCHKCGCDFCTECATRHRGGTACPCRRIPHSTYAAFCKRLAAAPVKAAPVKAAPVKAAPVKAAPVTTAPVTTAPVKAAPVTTAPAIVERAEKSVKWSDERSDVSTTDSDASSELSWSAPVPGTKLRL